MAVHVALLRGINVGGAHRVPMAELRALLTDAGYENVRTYVQSGNVVLGSGDCAAAVGSDLTTLISDQFGFHIPVIVRSRPQLAQVVDGDPFGAIVTEPKLYQVTFLDAALPPEAKARIDALPRDGEQLVIRGREIYTWYPDGIARSKLGAGLAAKGLGVTATARNWRTVLTLLEMAGN